MPSMLRRAQRSWKRGTGIEGHRRALVSRPRRWAVRVKKRSPLNDKIPAMNIGRLSGLLVCSLMRPPRPCDAPFETAPQLPLNLFAVHFGHQFLTEPERRGVGLGDLDRLLHHSVTISIRGESYRLKDKRKAGVFQTEEVRAET